MFTPRPYQQKQHSQVWSELETARSVCAQAPTGAGKGRLISMDVLRCRAEGKKVAVLSHRKLLTDQLIGIMEDNQIPFGVRAADYKEYQNFGADVQIVSVQTEKARAKNIHWDQFDPDLAILDEVHLLSTGYTREYFDRVIGRGGKAIGYTATPVNLSEMFDVLVQGPKLSELRAGGWLLPAWVYDCGPANLDKIEKKRNENTGEFSRNVVSGYVQQVFGSVYGEFKDRNKDGLPSLFFAPGVADSKWLVDNFAHKGVRMAHIDGDDIYVDGEIYKKDTDTKNEIFKECSQGKLHISNRFVCLDSETEILTDQGWVGMGQMTQQHKVANWDQGTIYFAEPKAIIQRRRLPGERMVFLETPRRSIRVTEAHQMLYRTWDVGKFLKCSAAELVDRSVKLPVSGLAAPSEAQIDQPKPHPNMKRRITVNACLLRSKGWPAQDSYAEAERRANERDSLRYKQPQELTDEECEFIGFWVGDGNRNVKKDNSVEYRLWQSESSVNINARIESLMGSMGVDYNRKLIISPQGGRVTQWSLSRGTGFGSQNRRGLFHLEPYLEKSGSQLWWGLSEHQFKCFVRGLWMANGLLHLDNPELPTERLVMCSARRELFDLLQAIAVCRGYRATVKKYRQSRGEDLWIYYLSLNKEVEHRMTKYSLQFEDGWKDEEVWCVESDSGNIITRRRGTATVMGNCREGVDLPFLYYLGLAAPIGSIQSFIQTCGRILRPYPGYDHVVIADHGGNCRRFALSPNDELQWDILWQFSSRQIESSRRMQAQNGDGADPGMACPQCKLMWRKLPESGVCKCGYVIRAAYKCPDCSHEHRVWPKHHRCEKCKSDMRGIRRRPIIEADGRLAFVKDDTFLRDRVKELPDSQKIWSGRYLGNKKHSATRTFAQAYASANHEHWKRFRVGLPKNLDLMPINEYDWHRRVKDVPMENLRNGAKYAKKDNTYRQQTFAPEVMSGPPPF